MNQDQTTRPPPYLTPHFVAVSIAPEDRDQDMFAVPRWVLGVLAGELSANSGCDGSEPGCALCDAIRVAKEASENGN